MSFQIQRPAFGCKKYCTESVNLLEKEGVNHKKAIKIVKKMVKDKDGVARIEHLCPNTHEGIASWVFKIIESTAGIIAKMNK